MQNIPMQTVLLATSEMDNDRDDESWFIIRFLEWFKNGFNSYV